VNIFESFYNYVSNNSTITSALASADAIFPEFIPQDHSGFPAVSYSLAQDEDIPLLNGSKSETGMAVIQVSIWAVSYVAASDVATIFKAQLIGYRGTFDDHTADYIRKEEGGEITLPYELDTGLCGVRLSFAISYY